ncbi:hypothetical protein KVQ82_17555 [Pseudomonas sp. AO-1]|uniref:hypothetical protein n=1 Tax=Pseudomonas sp. AO-1 TaxID=2855434 RepID=UPI001C76437E|nr:hypothetical protein [Pseudomonas sp. AO-1]QXZ11887.1 hypothetical protein KVQ82_17555 [Pseudomonas sp. AO-1]
MANKEEGGAMTVWEPINGVYMATTATTPFLVNLGWLEKWANSPLITAVIGGMIGAGFGAWAAGYIAKRGKRYESINEEIRACNLAMLLSQQCFNLALTLKIDAVKPITEAYNIARGEYLDTKVDAPSERQSLQKIHPISPPLDALRTTALEHLTLPGPAIRAVLQVVESTNCLNRALILRNELTDTFLHQQFPPGMNFHHMYFGIPKDGTCHAGYMDSMKSMTRYNDEALFFSMTLCQMLDDQGVQLRKERKKLSRGKVSINRFRLNDRIPEGIIPNSGNYAEWFAGYEVHTVSKKRWYWSRR